MRHQNMKSAAAPIPEPTGIVSVNDRGGASTGMTGKVAFILLVVGLVIIGGLIGFNKYRAAKKADEASSQITAGAQSQQAEAGKRRTFNTDPPPLPGAATTKTTTPNASTSGVCTDYTSSQPLLGPDGNPMTAPSGQPIRVCKNGQVIVPAVVPMPGEPGHPIAVIPNSATRSSPVTSAAPTSRYGGDILLPASGNAATASAIDPNNPYIRALLNTSLNPPASAESASAASEMSSSNQSGAKVSSDHHGAAASPPRGSDATKVTATMIGDRDMILPEGRSIDCNLSVRLVNEVSGKATCVLSSNVFSDNGRVVLAERGSTAIGEYVAITAQGQRRLFVLWTRLQTPKGVVINVNSPAADALGTSGLPGYVDNRWAERIGAAVLLSLVEDAIGYETAKASSRNGNGGAQGIAVFQSTTQTGHSLAERILDSTINIKPTIYKNQGDRATIFVSRDLDFGSVYALRAK